MDVEEHKLDSEEVKRLAYESKELLADRAFQAAILALRKQWFGELMTIHDNKAFVRLTLKLQALEAIPQQLQVFVNDYTWAEKGKH